MAYIRYKSVTKDFDFYDTLEKKELPKYVKDYIYLDEILLTTYRSGRDHAVFTNKKIIIFDETKILRKKEITAIPYRSVSAHTIIFRRKSAEIQLLLDSGHPFSLKFSNMNATDKVRLRLLYNIMSANICGQDVSSEVLKRVINNNLDYKEE